MFTLSLPAQADSFRDLLGERFRGVQASSDRRPPVHHADSLHRWNQIAINASGLDHSPVLADEIRVFGEQVGPGRSSRAMAIVHIAMADAVSAVRGSFKSYTGVKSSARTISLDAALSRAAHDTLIVLYPSQAASFDAYLTTELARIRGSKQEKANGQALGRRTAAAVLAMRTDDGVQKLEPRLGVDHFPSNLAGRWRQDPISEVPVALGAYWGECTPLGQSHDMGNTLQRYVPSVFRSRGRHF